MDEQKPNVPIKIGLFGGNPPYFQHHIGIIAKKVLKSTLKEICKC
jgi:hypothetical protein